MGILDRLGSFFANPPGPPPLNFGDSWSSVDRSSFAPVEVRAVNGDLSGRPWGSARGNSYRDSLSTPLVKDAFAKITVIFACATILGDAVAESPMRVYRDKDGEPVEDPNHRVRAILADPNPRFSEAEFWALTVSIASLFGFAAIRKVRSKAGLPVELWHLRNAWLKCKKQQNAPPTWEYRVPGNPVEVIPNEDLIIIPFRDDPTLEYTGIAPANVAAREAGIDIALTDHLKDVLDNGGMTQYVLVSPDPIVDPSIRDAIQLRWAADYGGSGNWSRIPILHGGWDVKQVGMNLNEMAWPDLRSLNELRICQAFRVPPELVLAAKAMESGQLTTTQREGAMADLQKIAATPLRNRIDGALTRGLLREYTDDPTITLEFDVSEVKALQEDEDKRSTRVIAQWTGGLRTRNEARQALGLPALAATVGDVVSDPFSATLTPAPLAGARGRRDQRSVMIREIPMPSPVALGPGERRYRDVASLSIHDRELRASAITVNRKSQKKLAEILERKMRGYWKAQAKRVIDMATRSMETRTIADVDWDEELKLLREILERFYHSAGETAFKATADLLGVEISWDVTNPNISRVIKDLGKRIKGINDESREQLQTIVDEALGEGVSIDELSDRLQEKFEEWSASRATTVARTESQVAYNRASVLSYEETGEVDEAELHDNPDHTDSYGASDGLTCAERNGLVVKLADVGKHIDAEHPRGSLGISPILRTALGEE